MEASTLLGRALKGGFQLADNAALAATKGVYNTGKLGYKILKPGSGRIRGKGLMLTGGLIAAPVLGSALKEAPPGFSAYTGNEYTKGFNAMNKISSSVMTGSLMPHVKTAGLGSLGGYVSEAAKLIGAKGGQAAQWIASHKGLAAGIGTAGLGAAGVYEMSDRPADTASYLIGKKLFPSLTTRVRADETFANEFFKTLGKETATKAMGIASGGLQQGATAVQRAVNGVRRSNIVEGLMKNDDVISQADPEMVSNAIGTLSRFAPTLSTDPNAVRSYLREAVTYGAGPDYATISNIANTEDRLQQVGLPNFGQIGGR